MVKPKELKKAKTAAKGRKNPAARAKEADRAARAGRFDSAKGSIVKLTGMMKAVEAKNLPGLREEMDKTFGQGRAA